LDYIFVAHGVFAYFRWLVSLALLQDNWLLLVAV
jgi:hypothetical protein